MKLDIISSPLLTDLYQLTMLQGYLDKGMTGKAVFEFFVRNLPPERGFLVACGLETLLACLESMRFQDDEIDYLVGAGRFSGRLIDYLRGFRFSGDVYALPEGTVFFAQEPVVRIVAPLPMAQFIETRLINILQYEILIASKAARCFLAADDRAILVDFGLRRAHGAEAGLLAARASYIAGFRGTSTVIAEPLLGIPGNGTMAHSFIQAHHSELDAFINFCRSNPGNTTLLIDTYDTLTGAARAVTAASLLTREGIRVNAVRLDSGDILTLSKAVRNILDRGGFPKIKIFVSGNMDEFSIRDLLGRGAPIDGFGVGTKLDTSADVPYLECAYKLMSYEGKPRLKKSPGKVTLPGAKQIYRRMENGIMAGDLLTIAADSAPGTPLLKQVMAAGGRIEDPLDLNAIAASAQHQLKALPAHFRRLAAAPPYPVAIAPALADLARETEAAVASG
ncbi:MAG TPA: nicotinate phosphoribosyltransferase [Syntrophales bacterium]|nr:nicotinate phosphoribosyltransferase [Syntrophales bacterium]